MLKIRLKRGGRKKSPIYKIVLMNCLSKRDGKEIYNFGYYDPIKKVAKWDKAAALYYILQGAVPTDTIRHLISFQLNVLESKEGQNQLDALLSS